MRISFTYILLFCYIFAIFRPITPAVEDFLAHTIYEAQHLSTVHYENGEYHLHKELSDASDADKNSKSDAPSFKVKPSLSAHIKSENNFAYVPSFVESRRKVNHIIPIEIYIQQTNPPPEFSFSI